MNTKVKPIDLAQVPERREPASVLLVRPSHFDVVDVKNPYMVDSTVDQALAMRQWEALRAIYQGLVDTRLLESLKVIPGAEGLEDMVFCANQSLPALLDDGRRIAVMSHMRHESRRREVPHFQKFYREEGYETIEIPEGLQLEGMGDCIYHPFRKLLWMGHGYRTSLRTADHLRRILGMEVIPLKLVSPYFYHLDTCFLPVNEHKVLLCEDAFDEADMASIRAVFSEVVHIPREIAVETFCLNTHCIYSMTDPIAITPVGDHPVRDELKASGYRVLEAETSEFIKAGGSVYCMKMMIY